MRNSIKSNRNQLECSISFQMSACATALRAGPHWQARVIHAPRPEPSRVIETVINHCQNNAVACHYTGERQRAMLPRTPLAHSGSTDNGLPRWRPSSIQDHDATVTSVGAHRPPWPESQAATGKHRHLLTCVTHYVQCTKILYWLVYVALSQSCPTVVDNRQINNRLLKWFQQYPLTQDVNCCI